MSFVESTKHVLSKALVEGLVNSIRVADVFLPTPIGERKSNRNTAK
jgi:hypothetical protein